MFLPTVAHAQSGDWYPNWTSVDDAGEPSQFPYTVSGWTLHGIPTGHSENTYGALTRLAFSNDAYGYLLSAYLPHRSHPTAVSPTTDYLFGGTSPETGLLSVKAFAYNYFQEGTYGYYDSFGSPAQDVVGGVTTTASNTLKLRLEWHPLYTGDDYPAPAPPPAPDHVDLLVSTYLVAGADLHNAPNIGGSISGSVGRSASATAYLPRFGETVLYTLTDSDSVTHRSGSVNGRHLLRVGMSGGIAELALDAQAQASAPVHASGAAPVVSRSYADANAQVSAWGQIDNRAVTISIAPTFHKANVEERVGHPVQDQYGNDAVEARINLRDSDGTGHGDIGLGTSDGSTFASTHVTYNGDRVGSWHIDGDTDHWHHSLLHDNTAHDDEDLYDTLTSYSPDISPFIVRYNGQRDTSVIPDASEANEQATLGTDHVHLTYTDGGDGAVATANYYMKVHRSEEILSSRQSGPEFIKHPINDLQIDSPGFAIHGGGTISCTWNAPGVLWQIGSAAFQVLPDAPWPASLQWIPSLLDAVGIGYDKIAPQPDHGGMAFTDEVWNQAPDSAFPADHPRGSASMSEYHMIPHLLGLYKPKYELVDHYDLTGFTSEEPAAPADYQGPCDWTPEFVYFPTH